MPIECPLRQDHRQTLRSISDMVRSILDGVRCILDRVCSILDRVCSKYSGQAYPLEKTLRANCAMRQFISLS